jgi:hypothetical protein
MEQVRRVCDVHDVLDGVFTLSVVLRQGEEVHRPQHEQGGNHPSRPQIGGGWCAGVAHWCTIFVSGILDGSPMHPRCRRVTAQLA